MALPRIGWKQFLPTFSLSSSLAFLVKYLQLFFTAYGQKSQASVSSMAGRKEKFSVSFARVRTGISL